MENRRKKESRKEASGETTSANGSRWQPTKEQIEILESVYSAGVKTPSAEQIQQITARLSTYGHIEGKNVFYWFQNTKARRRQKQKQDQRLAYLTRFYHAPPIFPIPPPPPPHYVPPIIPNGYYYYPYGEVAGPAGVEPTGWGPRECKTLELFPLQPGGRGGGGGDSNSGASSNSSDRDDEYYYSASACKDGEEGFIDFLSGNCCSS